MNRELKNIVLEIQCREMWETYARLKRAIFQEMPKCDYKLGIFRDLHHKLYGAHPNLESIFGKEEI